MMRPPHQIVGLGVCQSPEGRHVFGRMTVQENLEMGAFARRDRAALTAEYEGRDPPLPGNWGGFRLTPRVFEFWQHRDDRLHDRLRYTPLPGGSWTVDRLAP